MNKFILVSSILLLAGCSSFKKLPACDSPEVTNILKNAIVEAPAYKLLGLLNVEIKDVAERPSSTSDKKICRGTLNLGDNLGSQVIYFSVDWQNKDKGEFWVQTIPNPTE
ncbi:hypothetical protein [Acinetobacter baumannii]|uniref:hypothetical protein n=1 Tax=Acinetobacter baumannii TaxID=470 RepID=UPI0001FFC427|nr:hypothetical protein [Acinetobacter baumannii]ADX93460.1 hypothetical protein ABTW07_3037 [Acinetobacter baumannii TCDC-AB0715]MBP4453463.1 hypothetical protein [Acinetobacter baumannii]MBP4542031.1 hypothetical protein [Acinetobacter baumannii]MCF4653664.1 hypothetical protein [Acinetobacter baumannii]MDW5390364.1 hypothetical protein [Acinetobacter baumannii]